MKKADDEKVYYSNTDIARLNVSTIFLRPLSIVEANKLRNKPTGVLLMNGDFIEGELNSLDDKLIIISPTPLLKQINVAGFLTTPDPPSDLSRSLLPLTSSLHLHISLLSVAVPR